MAFIRCLLILIFMISFYSISLGGGISKVGTTAAPFLEIGVGSKATSLGSAFTALADDATAMYWNPAGIDRLVQNEVTFNYIDWFAGMQHFFIGGVLKTESLGSFGISVTSFSTPEMLVRTVEEPEGVGLKFNAADIAIGISYAKNLTDRFSFGASVKYIQQRIWHMSSDAVAVDFGILYRLPWDKLQFGMSIQNFGTKMRTEGVDAIVFTDIDETNQGNNTAVMADLHTKEWALPLTFRFGLAYNAIESEQHNLTLLADFIHPNNNFESLNLGAEYKFLRHFAIRLGYKSLLLDNSEEGLTLGCGVGFESAFVDYSFEQMEHLGYIHQFSMKLRF